MKRSRKYILSPRIQWDFINIYRYEFRLIFLSLFYFIYFLLVLNPNYWLFFNQIISLCGKFSSTPTSRIWWWSIVFVECKKCWTASQRKGFQYFKLMGKPLIFSSPLPFPLLLPPQVALSLSFSAIFSLSPAAAAASPGLSLDRRLQGQ